MTESLPTRFVDKTTLGYLFSSPAKLIAHLSDAFSPVTTPVFPLVCHHSFLRLICPFPFWLCIAATQDYMRKNRGTHEVSRLCSDDAMSYSMRAELSLQLKHSLLTNALFTAWSKLNPDCIGEVLLRMRTQIHLQGDVIFNKGSVGRELFFVSKGRVDVLDARGVPFASCRAGDMLGEMALLTCQPRGATARAGTFVELQVLNRDDFAHFFTDFPECLAEMRRAAILRMFECVSECHPVSLSQSLSLSQYLTPFLICP